MPSKTVFLKFLSALLIICIFLSSSVNLTVSGNNSVTDTETVDETIIDATDATGEAEASEESQYEENEQTLCPEAIFGKADVSGLDRLTYKEDLNTLVYANADGTETMSFLAVI